MYFEAEVHSVENVGGAGTRVYLSAEFKEKDSETEHWLSPREAWRRGPLRERFRRTGSLQGR